MNNNWSIDKLKGQTLMKMKESDSTSPQIRGLEKRKEIYDSCKDFKNIYNELLIGNSLNQKDFQIHDGYLFKDNRLCIPSTSIRDFLI